MKSSRLSGFAVGFLAASLASSVLAQESRATLVERIAAAQGLTEIFDQQLEQQREAVKGYAVKLFEEAVAAGGGQANPKEKAALDKLATQSAALFSGKEVTAAWIANYGKGLSLEDLRTILGYYESPIGRKDVAATKAAMPAFSAWMTEEAGVRSTSLIKEFVSELQAARK